jgi:hypothetical protein
VISIILPLVSVLFIDTFAFSAQVIRHCVRRRAHSIMSGLDSEDDDVGSVGAFSAASTDGCSLAVIIVSVCYCKMCRASCNDRSPMSNATSRDQWGGLRPWGHYSKVRDDAGEAINRKPDGKLCLLCVNVFNALGRALSLSPGSFSRTHTNLSTWSTSR